MGKFIDMTGQVFGRLTVLKKVGNINGKATWLCECECGSQTVVRGDSLRTGNTQSCGCVRSMGENIISSLLTENNVKFQKEYSFNDLRGINGGLLRFDFAVFKNNKLSHLIEFDGVQHYDEDNLYYKEDIIIHDEVKNRYCAARNIPLIRLRDYKNLTIEDLLLK